MYNKTKDDIMTKEIEITEDELIENMDKYLELAQTTNIIITANDGTKVVMVSVDWYNEAQTKINSN